MWKHSLSFLIPTRMRHVRSFHHVVDVAGWHFRAWWCVFERKTFLARFFCLPWRETWETSLHDAWIFRSRADDEFSAVELQMPHSWMGEYFSPFFRSHRRECLAELKFGELLRRRLWEWQRCERAVCHAIRIQYFLSGGNDDHQGTPLLWPGTQEASTCSATKRRATRIGTPSRRLVKMFHPQQSDKSPGSDRSGWTNFVNLKRSCFKLDVFKNCFRDCF